jgi:hypothetical protein
MPARTDKSKMKRSARAYLNDLNAGKLKKLIQFLTKTRPPQAPGFSPGDKAAKS